MTTSMNAAALDLISSDLPATNSDVRELTGTEIDATSGALLDPISMLVGGAIAGGTMIILAAAAKYLTS
ncbi:MAG: hypothetical protein AB7O57_18680 [Hyphomicrobiaceae bacterium]